MIECKAQLKKSAPNHHFFLHSVVREVAARIVIYDIVPTQSCSVVLSVNVL